MGPVTMSRYVVALAFIPMVMACETPVEPEGGVDKAPAPDIPPPPRLALDFMVQPTDGYTSIRLVPDVEVSVVNEQGTPVTGVTLVVTVALGNNTSGATLSGTTTVHTTDGLVRFTDLTVDRPGEGYTLIVGATDFLGAESDPFTIVDPGPLVLITPIGNTAIRQNDPTIGCPAHQHRGHGFLIRFAWIAHPSAARYRLFAQHRGARYPIVNRIVENTEYIDLQCNAFVIDRNLDDWEWFVDALDGFGIPIDKSAVGKFRFAPCRLADGRSCTAPA